MSRLGTRLSGSGLVFAEFFQNERDTGRKGIVVIMIGGPR